MAELDPIRQLQHLLDDPGKVLEKISNIQSVIDALKGQPAPSTAIPSQPPAGPANDAAPKNPEHSFDRLLQMLRDMRVQIEERMRPLAVQALEAEVASLCARAKQDQRALKECIERIDGSIAVCLNRIDEGRQAYDRLISLNRRLTELGDVAEPLMQNPYSQSAPEFIGFRIESLRQEGKLR